LKKISAGITLDKYYLQSHLGSGGFASVYKASRAGLRNTLNNTQYAVKISYPWECGQVSCPFQSEIKYLWEGEIFTLDVLGDGLYVETGCNFIKSVIPKHNKLILKGEFEWLRACGGNLLPRVYNYQDTGEVAYYAMEYIPGIRLRDELIHRQQSNSFLICHLIQLVKDLDGLYKSDAQFFHGDVKPENIILDQNQNRFRLIDPAYRNDDSSSNDLDMTLSIPYNPLGLCGYTADTFAVAVILMEIIGSTNPFRFYHKPLSVLKNAVSPEEHQKTTEQRINDISNFLSLDTVLKRFAAPITTCFQNWFLHPSGYDQLAEELQLLSDEGAI